MNKINFLAITVLSILLMGVFPLFAQDSVAQINDSVLPAHESHQEVVIHSNTSGAVEMPDKTNILSMERSSGFQPMTIFRGLLGMLGLILIAFLFSTNKRAVNWRVVITGLGLQLALAVGVLYVPFIQAFFEFVGKLFVLVLDFTKEVTEFLFKSF